MMKKLKKALERLWAGAVRMMRDEEQEPLWWRLAWGGLAVTVSA
jgi:predicted nicotinamide N-methyase